VSPSSHNILEALLCWFYSYTLWNC